MSHILKTLSNSSNPTVLSQERKEYSKLQVIFLHTLFLIRAQAKQVITTLHKKGKMTIKFRDMPVTTQSSGKVTLKFRLLLYALKITMMINLANTGRLPTYFSLISE